VVDTKSDEVNKLLLIRPMTLKPKVERPGLGNVNFINSKQFSIN